MTSTLRKHAHPILFIDELIIEFLQHLCPPDIDDADINAAGLTCKAWRDPSLIVKWREADLKCLLSVLAPLCKPKHYYPRFARVPNDSDHHRFHDIARRVHSLQDRVLFPNLHSAGLVACGRFSSAVLTNITGLLPLFPSSLSQLALSIDPTSGESRAILVHNIASRFSDLSSIKIYWVARIQAEVDAMVELLKHNHDLRHVTIYHSIGSATTEALSRLPHLGSLEIGTGGLTEFLNCPGCLRLGPFAQLKSLTIRSPLDTTAFALLDSIGAHHSLQTLKMISPYKPSEQSDLDTAVDGVVKHPLLRNLSFCQLLVPVTQKIALPVIAACTMLESLEISILMTSDTLTESTTDTPVIDEVVGDLLQDLPHLTELTLSFANHKSLQPLLTFRALAIAIAHCPLLKSATLVINTRVPVAFALAPLSNWDERPRVLDFSFTVSGQDDSLIDDPKYVAAVLTQLCPEVDIRIKKDVEGWYRWGVVARILSKARGVF
ncbi:hypothetical protein FRB95_003074 [Tulasnella sp. JGI-2019a]|nr:hypothetical protein FRB95_003074 [Tulasnella sp. JGI-2019a]